MLRANDQDLPPQTSNLHCKDSSTIYVQNIADRRTLFMEDNRGLGTFIVDLSSGVDTFLQQYVLICV